MTLKIVVLDLELSRRAKRLILAAFGFVAAVTAAAITYANVPTTWMTGDTLKATDLNGNFGSLDGRVTTLEGIRHESASVNPCSTTDCTSSVTATTSADWIGMITHDSTGNYTVFFKQGLFSAPPTCVVTGNYRGGAGATCMPTSAAMKTSQGVICLTIGTTAQPSNLADAAFNIACSGPR
jgi:hypothetical protein